MTEKEMILQAYGEIEDCFIEESLEFSGTSKRISSWRWVGKVKYRVEDTYRNVVYYTQRTHVFVVD